MVLIRLLLLVLPLINSGVASNWRIHQGLLVPPGSTAYPHHVEIGVFERGAKKLELIFCGGTLISLGYCNKCFYKKILSKCMMPNLSEFWLYLEL